MAVGITVDTSDDTIAAPTTPCSVKITNTGATAVLVYVVGLHTGYPTTAQDLATGFSLAASASEIVRIGTRSVGQGPKFGAIHFKTAAGSSTIDVYKVASGI
jgi:hypothetical protein